MAHSDSLYTPYGAHALKASYQTNFMLAMLITASMIALTLAGSWLLAGSVQGIDSDGGVVRGGDSVLRPIPPPRPYPEKPDIGSTPPKPTNAVLGIPTPIDDEEFTGDEMLIASNTEKAVLVGPGPTDSDGNGQALVIDENLDEDFPEPDKFIVIDQPPEMIYEHMPEYPRMARKMGISGTVWVQALVDREGNVREARVAKSSDFASLDEAAVRAAYKNTYRPAIRDGNPVACWVSYQVKFELD